MKRFIGIGIVTMAAAEGFALANGCAALGPNLDRDSGADSPSNPDGSKLGVPHLVIVNGLDQAVTALGDDNVRVCLGSSATDRPLPDDPARPVPLSNYPGIPIGGGADLGDHDTPSTIFVISAKEQSQNYAGSPTPVSCESILGTGASGKPHLTVSVPFTTGPNRVVVLLDGTGDAGVFGAAASATIDDATYGPNADAGLGIHAQVGAFGPWAGAAVLADVLDSTDAATTALGTFAGGEMAAAPSVMIALPTFDGSLRFTSPGSVPDVLTQTFQSVQAVADPATSPEAFYGVRANFLFVALGAPNVGDASVAPAFGGRALHIAAIPYVP